MVSGVAMTIFSRGAGYETLQVSKAITLALLFGLKASQPYPIFKFAMLSHTMAE